MERRKFINLSSKSVIGASLALGATAHATAHATSKNVAPSDRVRLGLIGCKGIGWANLNSVLKVPGVEFVSLCDVDQNILNERSAELEKTYGQKNHQLWRFPKNARYERPRRCVCMHPRSLARSSYDLWLPGRKGCLCGETACQ